jgi:hypothetical protein
MSTLWMEVLPGPKMTRVRVQSASQTLLRARLPQAPSDPRAVAMLCEAVALWTGRKVCAALVVEGSDAFCATRPWLNTFDTLTRPPRFEVHFVSAAPPTRRRRDPDRLEEAEELGSYRALRRRIFSEVEF